MNLIVHDVLEKTQREAAIRILLKTVPHGVDAHGFENAEVKLREGLRDTPSRAAIAWGHWLGGYDIDPKALLKTFEDGAEGYDEMVLVKDIPFYSLCEHHLSPFFGRITIGYLPQGKVIGLSKLNRVVDAFARRLQVQERLTVDVAQCIMNELRPHGVGVMIRARHLCMESRGVCQQGHSTTTQCLLGSFREEQDVRAEFLTLAVSNSPL